jgi:hypothetical protein
VENHQKASVHRVLGMPARYYEFNYGPWIFIVLDGNDLSFHGSASDQITDETQAMFSELEQSKRENAQTWNGGIGSIQLKWMEQILIEADSKDQNVIVLCHFPVYPDNAHNLWNDEELLNLVSKYPCVKAWWNGHNHAGSYDRQSNIHFLTFPGMVETANINAFSIVDLHHKMMHVKGFGRVKEMELILH